MSGFRSLRILSIMTLLLLALQYELGMAVNLSPTLAEVPPLAATPAAIWGALAKVGAGAPAHMLLGTLLAAFALVCFVLAVRSGARSAAVTSAASFLFIASAAVSGVLFTLSGFKNDHFSHGMATMFLLAFSVQFVQIGILTVRLHQRKVAEST